MHRSIAWDYVPILKRRLFGVTHQSTVRRETEREKDQRGPAGRLSEWPYFRGKKAFPAMLTLSFTGTEIALPVMCAPARKP